MGKGRELRKPGTKKSDDLHVITNASSVDIHAETLMQMRGLTLQSSRIAALCLARPAFGELEPRALDVAEAPRAVRPPELLLDPAGMIGYQFIATNKVTKANAPIAQRSRSACTARPFKKHSWERKRPTSHRSGSNWTVGFDRSRARCSSRSSSWQYPSNCLDSNCTWAHLLQQLKLACEMQFGAAWHSKTYLAIATTAALNDLALQSNLGRPNAG